MKEGISEFSAGFWRRTAHLRSGVGLVCTVVALIGLRLLWIQWQQPAHLKAITTAFGTASFFGGTPQFDQNGRRFTYVKTAAHDYALYLCDAETGQKQILSEQPFSAEATHRDLWALPWAPDDSALLYQVENRLIVYPLDTNQPPAVVEINPVSEAVWLSPEKFAYIVHDDNSTNLCYAQKQADGHWERHEFLSQSNKISSLTALDEDTVAWLQDNVICRASLTGSLPATHADPAEGFTNSNAAPPGDGLALWLDASKLKQPDQSAVLWMSDLSRSKNDATWNERAPSFNGTNSLGALNGKPTIHFESNGSSTNATGLRTRSSPGIIGAAPRSIFVVMRRDPSRSMMVSMGNMSIRNSMFSIELGTSLALPMTGAKNTRYNVSRQASTNWNILELVYDGASQKGYLNGLLKGIATNRIATADKVVEIGLRSDTAGKSAKSADGDFAELLIYNRAVDFTERREIEGYLNGKWFGRDVKNSSVPFAWRIPSVAGVTSFSYDKTSGEFLLKSTDGNHEFLWQYDPQVETLTKIAENNSIVDEQWFGDGASAYFAGDITHGRVSDKSSIVLRNGLGVETDRVLPKANILWFKVSADGGELVFLGTPTNQPFAGIWRFDLASKKLQPAILYSDEPSDYAKNVNPENITIKTASGKKLLCTIYPPVNFNPHKRYPLLIGNTIFYALTYRSQAASWAPAVANCGGYVIIVDRDRWFGGLDNWGADIVAAYGALKPTLRIDSSQMFLFGSSVETTYMNTALTNSPGLWKGAILLSPTSLPDLSAAPLFQPRPKILISDGSEEHREAEFKKYQEEALKWGVLVETVIHPGEFHNIVGNAAQLERTRAIVHFIFEE